jgi:hypothetical protein
MTAGSPSTSRPIDSPLFYPYSGNPTVWIQRREAKLTQGFRSDASEFRPSGRGDESDAMGTTPRDVHALVFVSSLPGGRGIRRRRRERRSPTRTDRREISTRPRRTV